MIICKTWKFGGICLDIGDPIKTTVEEISKVLNIGNVIRRTHRNQSNHVNPSYKNGHGIWSWYG